MSVPPWCKPGIVEPVYKVVSGVEIADGAIPTYCIFSINGNSDELTAVGVLSTLTSGVAPVGEVAGATAFGVINVSGADQENAVPSRKWFGK